MPPLDISDDYDDGVNLRIVLVGCGKMGSAMLQGWIDAKTITHADIVDPYPPPESLLNNNEIFHHKDFENLDLENSDIIILAVKPQIMDDVCTRLKEVLPPSVPLLSVAAGKNIPYFQKYFGNDNPLIRAMPNTPAAIGKGMTALYAADNVNEHHKKIAHKLISCTGDLTWIEDESLMDAITAVSGSGPAYIFYLIEALAEAGTKAGLSETQSMQLARQTVIGAAALADHESETIASILRQNVTSPKGTTEAALNVLMDGRFQEIMTEAILAAKTRSIELSG